MNKSYFSIGFVLALAFGSTICQTPLVCTTAVQREDAVALANTILGIVENAVRVGSFFVQEDSKDRYNEILDNVVNALRNGWSAPGACDAIANPIADPLAQIPFVGASVQAAVKPAVLAACQARKQQLGCP